MFLRHLGAFTTISVEDDVTPEKRNNGKKRTIVEKQQNIIYPSENKKKETNFDDITL